MNGEAMEQGAPPGRLFFSIFICFALKKIGSEMEDVSRALQD
jgi:hypothetical protein